MDRLRPKALHRTTKEKGTARQPKAATKTYHKKIGLSALVFAAPLLLAGSNIWAAQQSDAIEPEQASGLQETRSLIAKDFMLATANPLATQAGYDVLATGGSAIDAMVAVQTVLGLVEPQSSGLGGGAFMVYYDAEKHTLTTFDGRETAPIQAAPALFLEDGEPLSFYDAVVGGRSVGTPGTVKLIYDTHTTYGSQPWEQLLTPAIQLAEMGFPVSSRLAGAINDDKERLSRYPGTHQYFFTPSGVPLPEGYLLKNPEYANTLKSLASAGADAFYSGEIALSIISTVQSAEDNPGVLSLEDLSNYAIIERAPTCMPYLSYEVCGMGPPSSGALTVGQILGLIKPFDLSRWGPEHPYSWQVIGDATQLAFADRGLYMADADFVTLPDGLLDPEYLTQRASLIVPGKPIQTVEPGQPSWKNGALTRAMDQAIELPSTSHFVIVDKQGNVVSMTTTIENGFGSRLMTNGFLLNNELTDFSFVPESNGKPVANRVEPGKRPRSSMSPTIVMQDGKPVLAIGSPGGSRIISYVTNALIRHLQWNEPLQQTLNSPHLINRFGTYDIESGMPIDHLAKELESLGYTINRRPLNSGLHAIKITEGQLTGAADPRREGVVMGQ